ncbi:sugar-binding transcriptional regulator [Vallitalea okinawensis]|uniref:sugar-binding transcriptional regulator n=1 Tax=Vallitalea okinawensis TaxID=2078660 RepID=UPI000CFCE4D0|nr:sugar-binding domain-containing protein [Vallitalea okinawensis]
MIYDRDEVLKLVEVAKMYYEDNLTQAEIAKRMGVSRPMVSKMLSNARELGIVQIQIKSPLTNDDYLMNKLKEHYGIKGGVIVPEAKTEYLTEQMILNHSIYYIKDELKHIHTLGMGWGYTIGTLVDKIDGSEMGNYNGGQVCPLIGTAHIPNKGYHPNELIRIFSEKTDFEPIFTYAPALPASNQEKKIYIQTEQQLTIQKKWEQLDAVIIAIRPYPDIPDLATALRFGNKLNVQKVVGTFLSYYYDNKGGFVESEEDHAIQISLDQLSKVQKVIAICPTNNKNALIGALKTGIITHLIADDRTVKDIIDG